MSLYIVNIYSINDNQEETVVLVSHPIGSSYSDVLKFIKDNEILIDTFLIKKSATQSEIADLTKSFDILTFDFLNLKSWTHEIQRVDFLEGSIQSNFKDLFFKIYHYNEIRGFFNRKDDPKQIAAFVLEETLEQFYNDNPKEIARDIVDSSSFFKHPKSDRRERLDSEYDSIVFLLGDIMLNIKKENPDYGPEEIYLVFKKGMSNILEANDLKSFKVDSWGKNIKGDNFKIPFIPLNIEEVNSDRLFIEGITSL